MLDKEKILRHLKNKECRKKLLKKEGRENQKKIKNEKEKRNKEQEREIEMNGSKKIKKL